jgi:hypothetical protein
MQALEAHRAVVAFVSRVAVRLGLLLLPRDRVTPNVPSRR